MRTLPVASTTLPAHPASSRAARAFVAGHLRSWDLDSAVEDAALLVSELVTNAILHGLSPIDLVVRKVRTSVRVEVFGDGSRSARPPNAELEVAGGRGLNLVEAVAARWGADDEAGIGDAGTRVWFEIAL